MWLPNQAAGINELPDVDAGETKNPVGRPKGGAKPTPGVDTLISKENADNLRGKHRRILPFPLLVELAALIMAQYFAGIPMTTTLLVPVALALAKARGYEDFVTRFKEGTIPVWWVRRFCRTIGLSVKNI